MCYDVDIDVEGVVLIAKATDIKYNSVILDGISFLGIECNIILAGRTHHNDVIRPVA